MIYLFVNICLYLKLQNSIRGALGSLLQAQIVIGFLIAYAVGPFVSYNAFNIISIVPAILFLILFFFMPDSPTYLLSKGEKNLILIFQFIWYNLPYFLFEMNQYLV